MEPSNSKPAVALPSRRPSRRLLFDRRYGWVVDEWKHPSEEALAGGRGMFCILPLAKAFWNTASKSIDAASNGVFQVIQRPDLLSPQTIQATLKTQLSRFQSSLCKPELNLLRKSGSRGQRDQAPMHYTRRGSLLKIQHIHIRFLSTNGSCVTQLAAQLPGEEQS